MRYLIVIISLVVCTTRLCGQSTLKAEIERELARDPNGAYNYAHSDGYRFAVDYRARQALGTREWDPEEQPASEAGQDISNDKGEQDETTIAIDRVNPNVIIAGSNDAASGDLGMPVYFTNDGGSSWHTSRLPALPDDRIAVSDPMIAASNDGHFYYAYLTASKYFPFPIQVVVAASTSGVNWTDMQPVDTSVAKQSSMQDKPAIAVDNSPPSPHYGRVYVVWTVSTDGIPSAGLRLAFSDDHGKTWSAAKVLTTDINDLFSQLSTGRNGEVLVSYTSYDDSTDYLLVSTNGGANFDRRVLHRYVPYPLNGNDDFSLKGRAGPRAYPYPAIQVDRSTNRLYTIYGTWNEDPVDSSAELLSMYSDDFGSTWSSSVPIFGGPEDMHSEHRDRFFPWLAWDEQTHQLSLVYYSSELDTSNLLTMPYRAIIGPNGPEQMQPIGAIAFNPIYSAHGSVEAFIGDYIGCDASRNRFAAAWTQNRAGATDGDVYAMVDITDSTASSVSVPVKLNADCVTLLPPFPNPARNKITLSFTLPVACTPTIGIYTSNGVVIARWFLTSMEAGSYIREFSTSALSAGNYIVWLSTKYGTQKQFLVIE